MGNILTTSQLATYIAALRLDYQSADDRYSRAKIETNLRVVIDAANVPRDKLLRIWLRDSPRLMLKYFLQENSAICHWFMIAMLGCL